jgi:membrane-bound inhibitor of C-type lysozyme
MAKILKFGAALLPPLFMALVTACTTDSQMRGSTRFTCESGGDLLVTFAPGRAIVRTSDGTVHSLPQAEAASGARYTNGTHEFWTRGREASWTIGRMVPIRCRAR